MIHPENRKSTHNAPLFPSFRQLSVSFYGNAQESGFRLLSFFSPFYASFKIRIVSLKREALKFNAEIIILFYVWQL